jgi:hypothetical protein
MSAFAACLGVSIKGLVWTETCRSKGMENEIWKQAKITTPHLKIGNGGYCNEVFHKRSSSLESGKPAHIPLHT